MKRLFQTALFLTLTAFTALGAQGDVKVDCRGAIKKLNDLGKKTGVLGSILVDGPQDKNVSYDKASVSITDKTKIAKQVGKERKAATFADLKVGQKVEVKFTGPMAESFPVQARAAAIVILEDR